MPSSTPAPAPDNYLRNPAIPPPPGFPAEAGFDIHGISGVRTVPEKLEPESDDDLRADTIPIEAGDQGAANDIADEVRALAQHVFLPQEPVYIEGAEEHPYVTALLNDPDEETTAVRAAPVHGEKKGLFFDDEEKTAVSAPSFKVRTGSEEDAVIDLTEEDLD